MSIRFLFLSATRRLVLSIIYPFWPHEPRYTTNMRRQPLTLLTKFNTCDLPLPLHISGQYWDSLSTVSFSQTHTVLVEVRHRASTWACLGDAEAKVDGWLTYQLIDEDELGLTSIGAGWQLKCTDQASRCGFNGIVRWSITNRSIDLEHIDLAFAGAAVSSVRHEVEFERERSGAFSTRQVGEGNDEVYIVGIACVFADFEFKGDAPRIRDTGRRGARSGRAGVGRGGDACEVRQGRDDAARGRFGW